MSILAERLVAIHGSLADAGVPHAFGGAIALAYCTGEPRATIDLDINVFVSVADVRRVLDALPAQVRWTQSNLDEIIAVGQTRAWWQNTPVDLFFDTHPFHHVAAARVRQVPFLDEHIPVLDCTTLAVFKVFFNRTKDWADVEAMAQVDQVDLVAVSAFVSDLLGADDERLVRLGEVVDRA